MRKFALVGCLCALALGFASGAALADPVVAQNPTLGPSMIAFTMGGEVWLVGRGGGTAHRITNGADAPLTGGNAFSPDGRTLAYTATYGGNANVYVIPVAGGTPRQLTFDAKPDEVVGWSHDGQRVLFRSTRNTFYPDYGLPRVYSVSKNGGPPEALPFPVAHDVSYSSDGAQVAVETQQFVNESWKDYRGGDQLRILLVDPKTLAQNALPGPLGNDFDPMWVGGELYFLSDRDGRMTLYAYDPKSGAVHREFDPGIWDVKGASAGPGGIIISQLDKISIFDPATRKLQPIEINPVGELPGTAPKKVDLSKQIVDAAVSDTGAVAFEARGRIVVIDDKKHTSIYGDSSHAERSPAFETPTKVSAFSDASGSYQLISHDIATQAKSNVLHFDHSAYYFNPVWSPDGKGFAYMDGMGGIWVASPGGRPSRIDRSATAGPWLDWDAAWSPDGTRLAYSRLLPNGLAAVFVWSAASGQIQQVTPSDVEARHPAWSADGGKLWFLASNDTPPAQAYLGQMDKLQRQWTSRVFWTKAEGGGWSRPQMLSLPARRYEGLVVQKQPGQLLILETVVPPDSFNFSDAPTQTLLSVDADAADPKAKPLIKGISGFSLADFFGHFQTTFRASSDRSRFLYRKDGDWTLATIKNGAVSRQDRVSLGGATIETDPRAEWRQMFNESFRELDYFFHDPTHPPRDFAAWKQRYEPLVRVLASRQDLTYLLNDVAGELHMSHAGAYTPMPDSGSPPPPATGTLAADFKIENGRYRITRVYHTTMFGAQAHAPLDASGLAAQPGDYITRIDAKSVTPDRSLAEYLQGTAGEKIKLCVSSQPTGPQQRCADVKPVANDTTLRFAAWLKERQAIVDRLSGGCLGYIHVPDTVESGMIKFNQARYAQHDRKGFVVDLRYNGGGYAADYFTEALTAPLLARWLMPEGRTMTTPGLWLQGPKAMVINGYCGSGCDTYAYFFKSRNIGPLIGTPTWGGVSGSGNLPKLIDGTYFTVPSYTFEDPQGNPALEGHAVQPTIPVEQTLKDMEEGRDPQLVRAVEVLMQKLGPIKCATVPNE